MKLTNTKIQLVLLISAGMALSSCKETPNYKVAREKVVGLHDKVMADSEKAINNTMILDSISKTKMPEMLAANPKIDTLAEKKKIAELVKKLTDADNVMMDWMNKFEPDIANKTNEQAIQYFEQELVKIKKLDSQYRSVISESDAYISKPGIGKVQRQKEHGAHKH